MAKKKNYVTRSKYGTIVLWYKCNKCPIIDKCGNYHIRDAASFWNFQILSREVYKAFIGDLPRKGTLKEFKRGEK